MAKDKATEMHPSGQGELASIGQNASWNMPPGTGLGGTSTDLNSLHSDPAANGPKGHHRKIKELAVMHAPEGNPLTGG